MSKAGKLKDLSREKERKTKAEEETERLINPNERCSVHFSKQMRSLNDSKIKENQKKRVNMYKLAKVYNSPPHDSINRYLFMGS